MAPKTRKECLFYIESINGRVLQHCERSQWEQEKLCSSQAGQACPAGLAPTKRPYALNSLRLRDSSVFSRKASEFFALLHSEESFDAGVVVLVVVGSVL